MFDFQLYYDRKALKAYQSSLENSFKHMDPLPEERKVKRIIWKRSKDKFGNPISVKDDNSLEESQDVRKRLHDESLQLDLSSRYDDVNGSQTCDAFMNHQKDLRAEKISYPTCLSVCPKRHNMDKPHMQQVDPNVNIILSGTACRRNTGPPVGAIEIGVSECAYYFRVALPGVRKDPGDFICEVEHDGKVHIHGVTTTGEKTVSRYSRVYNMTLQQQCPPGPFTISFCLPGPVDPSLFSPNFRSDGIFEGVLVKDNYSHRGRRRRD